MEVKSREQKVFTYTLSINGPELDEVIEELGRVVTPGCGSRFLKLYALHSKLVAARHANILDDEDL